ncbi:RHS repeat-associated core domain-containing protein [Pseudomonas putida]|uniref:RHS repeat-associated core domain-containing protein n=1 Tax=Pseudomonas putida TaxID=303 RepID=UPI0018A917F3|nr:RHS repeat-associated core domain-containing protein [Pseudomonas putida]MBF8727769.1 RHS repeat-associated core domain-containing protein [Pseudomonas putida]
MPPVQNAKHFYNRGQLCTVMTQDEAWSAVRAQAGCFGERLTYAVSSSIVLVLGANMSGSVIVSQTRDTRAHLSYTPYGRMSKPCFASGCVRFNSERPLEGTSDYLLGGYRLFSPLLMRFYSSDIDSPFADGGINAYGYCAGDPINYKDPSGRGKVALGTVSKRQSTRPLLTTPKKRYDLKYLDSINKSSLNAQRAALKTDDIQLYSREEVFLKTERYINTLKGMLRDVQSKPSAHQNSYIDLIAASIYGKASANGVPINDALGINMSTHYGRYLKGIAQHFRIEWGANLKDSRIFHKHPLTLPPDPASIRQPGPLVITID